MRKTDLGFLNYAAIDENSRRPNPPSRRISVTWSGHSLRQRCSNMQAGNSQFNGSKRSQFSLQAAFSLFSGNIYPIDLTGNRGLIPSGSVTPSIRDADWTTSRFAARVTMRLRLP
jgi:hypothetical protein